MTHELSCFRTIDRIGRFFESVEEAIKSRGIAQAEFDKIQRLATQNSYLVASNRVIFGKNSWFYVHLSVKIKDSEIIDLVIKLAQFEKHFIFQVNHELVDFCESTDFLWFTHKVFWYGLHAKHRGIRAKTEIKQRLKVFLMQS